MRFPAQRGNVLNVAGFLQTDNTFKGYYQQGSMDSETFIAYMEGFIQKHVRQKTILVLDNASFHTAKLVQQKRIQWQEQNLFLQFLPPYCSELNLIEISAVPRRDEWSSINGCQ